MGWVNSPPIFCAATETAADIANANLKDMQSVPHSLDTMAAPMDDDDAVEQRTGSDNVKPFSPSAAGPTISTTSSVPTASIKRDIGYFDVFVDDLLGLVQGKHNRSGVRSTLLRAIDEVFRLNDFYDDLLRQEPVFLKKLRQGDCSWNTIKVVLGWVLKQHGHHDRGVAPT